MQRTTLVLVAVTAAAAAVATPWLVGWRTEQLVRARVAAVEGDRDARIRLRIDTYEREIGSGLEGGGAPSFGETGLWDSAARTHSLDGDGVAGHGPRVWR